MDLLFFLGLSTQGKPFLSQQGGRPIYVWKSCVVPKNEILVVICEIQKNNLIAYSPFIVSLQRFLTRRQCILKRPCHHLLLA